jgi:magnesium-transporting ATPase (P-type)
MVCVAACPAENALQFALAPRKASITADKWQRRIIRPATFLAVLACIFFGLVLVAKMTGHWQTNLPREMYIDLVSHANEEAHPGM